MLNNSSKIIFLFILMTGTLITMSSTSWISAWMGLEINLLSFMPLISNVHNSMSSESAMKYFLTQALASSILLFAIMMSSTYDSMNWFMNFNMPSTIILSSLLLKLGAAPFHFWFPSVMEGLSWFNSLIMMTWQKLAPMIILFYISFNHFMLSFIILSTLVGSIGGLNQTSLRKIMAFSSINHVSWMLAAMMASLKMWLLYFCIYSFLSMSIILSFSLLNTFYFSQLFTSFSNSKLLKFFLFMNLLSLGGLPPFLGFYPKWIVIQQLSSNLHLTLLLILILFTLITLFFYLRIAFSAFMMNFSKLNFVMTPPSKASSLCITTSFLSSSLLPIVVISAI